MRAIDCHVHVPRHPDLGEISVEESLRKTFRLPPDGPTVEEMATTYRTLDIRAVIFSVDTRSNTGEPPDGNDYVAGIVDDHSDVFIGFATVDPWLGAEAVAELERAVTSLGCKGLKLHPVHQAFHPNEERFFPLYEACRDLGVPVLFHSGYAAAGGGTPGGKGLRLKYARPIPAFDDVAAEFPDLDVVLAHPSWPWVDEQIAVARHKTNVHIDLSGYAPKQIPEQLVRDLAGPLQDRVLFGSDYPYIDPERWLRGFERLDLPEEVVRKVTLENATRLLGL